MTPILRHIYDIQTAIQTDPSLRRSVELRAVVAARNAQKKHVFLTVQDDTGIIQTVLDREQSDLASRVLDFRVGDPISLKGATESCFKVPTVRIDDVARATNKLGAGECPLAFQIYGARLKKKISTFLEKEGYVEIISQVISPGYHSDTHDISITRRYHLPFSLNVSAVPQLVKAITVGSYQKLFTVFTNTVPGHADRALPEESLVISIIEHGKTLSEIFTNIDRIIRDILSEEDTYSPLHSVQPHSQLVRQSGLRSRRGIITPKIEIFDSKTGEIGRVCWPFRGHRHTGAYIENSGMILVEGFSEMIGGSATFSVATIHIDRIAELILERCSQKESKHSQPGKNIPA